MTVMARAAIAAAILTCTGVWFDGIRGDAQLFDGPSRSVACAVIAS